ncbi:MAG: hypothetical protein M3322_12045 [Actinomycetota bacterium]|nr:hypothetical protein [Actinomycetota bacterium]
MWSTIAEEAARESPLWRRALLPAEQRDLVPVFSPLGAPAYALGIETIYEGYLLHYGRARLFSPDGPETALLLGDYLYAHGLVRISASEKVDAVADLAELISLSAQLRADGMVDDGWAWAATVALLGAPALRAARAALREEGNSAPLAALARSAAADRVLLQALEAHRARVS